MQSTGGFRSHIRCSPEIVFKLQRSQEEDYQFFRQVCTVIFSDDRKRLENKIPNIQDIQDFLTKKLRLELHPQKVFIKTLASGVDFLGWVHFPDHRVLRTSTKSAC